MARREVSDAIDKVVGDINQPSKRGTDYDKPKLKLEGGVKEKKKSLGEKFSETFLSEDLNNVKGYVFKEIVVPSIKNLLFDTLSNAFQMIIFGTTSPARNGGRKAGYYDYNAISKSGSNNYRPVVNDIPRDRFDFRDLVFTSSRDAEEVLYTLFEYIHEYGHATVADYYNSIPGVSSVYTDKDWGWKDLSEVRVRPVRDGFILTLPRPIFHPEDK